MIINSFFCAEEMTKEFIDAQSLLDDSYRLADKILNSDFHPNYLVALWRGGTPVGVAVQEYLQCCGVKNDHIAVRTKAYTGMTEESTVRVFGLSYLVNSLSAGDNLLLVDDVFDTGKTIEAVVEGLKKKVRRNFPENYRIATVYWKPEKNKTELKPDFYLHSKDRDCWLVFPHELEDLTEEEMVRAKGAEIAGMLQRRKSLLGGLERKL